MRAPDAFVEVQGTGEQGTFSRPELDLIVDSAHRGISMLFDLQRRALGW
jgi:ribonuclease PH